MDSIPFHHLSQLFPLMEGQAFVDLVADIRAHGLLEPITLHEGMILDGRNRYAACVAAGIEPHYDEYEGDDPLAFVISKNLQRRHLDESQRAMVAARMANMNRGRHETNSSIDLFSQPQAAEAVNVSVPSLKRARVVLDNGTPELVKAVEQGQVAVSQAAQIARMEPEAQAAIVDRIVNEGFSPQQARRQEAQREVAQQSQAHQNVAIIRKQSAMGFLASIEPQSVDLLITDPPYSTDVIIRIEDFVIGWLPMALRVVKRTGRAYICIGAYPDELRAYLNCATSDSPVKLKQVLVWTYRNTLGPSPRMDYKQNWQAILYFCGVDAPPLDCPLMLEQFSVQDINAPDGRLGNRYHAWQKPDELAERLIRHSTQPGAFIIDPFAGTGTFVLAGARLGRRAIGCDLADDMIQIAIDRGCQYEE